MIIPVFPGFLLKHLSADLISQLTPVKAVMQQIPAAPAIPGSEKTSPVNILHVNIFIFNNG